MTHTHIYLSNIGRNYDGRAAIGYTKALIAAHNKNEHNFKLTI